ncbi:TetR/AcrR family transcriptional regulator [Rhodococcus sp. D2-41]|uniref:TetR/AcrR family transcriptional regulator n=1 Tax=Speluncibacter jeojiensis TaxID=2710754 RepID=UPI00240F2590|nr:TetR/AcrR family transcriptional regulator [Rhodococcus sp. D2-41]MDG3008606.1 TetR/AcrR family transcriptional regulator [Rhodococcus sp. D2-41]
MADDGRVRRDRRYGGVAAPERTALRRAALLRSGRELFGAHGFRGAGVKDLCAGAGVTDRYFYESFRNTGELFAAVFDEVVDELFSAVARNVAGSAPTGTNKLHAGIATFLDLLGEDPRMVRIVFIEPPAVGFEAEEQMGRALARFAGLVAETVVRARPDDVVPEVMTQIFALSLVGMIERVVIEKISGRIDLPMADLADRCTTLAAGTLRGLYDDRSAR